MVASSMSRSNRARWSARRRPPVRDPRLLFSKDICVTTGRTRRWRGDACPSRLVLSHRERTDSMPILLDHDDGPSLKDARAVRQNGCQPFEHMRRSSVVKTEDDHTRFSATRERRDLAEVEIEGEDDPVLLDRLRQNLAVRQPIAALALDTDGPGLVHADAWAATVHHGVM